MLAGPRSYARGRRCYVSPGFPPLPRDPPEDPETRPLGIKSDDRGARGRAQARLLHFRGLPFSSCAPIGGGTGHGRAGRSHFLSPPAGRAAPAAARSCARSRLCEGVCPEGVEGRFPGAGRCALPAPRALSAPARLQLPLLGAASMCGLVSDSALQPSAPRADFLAGPWPRLPMARGLEAWFGSSEHLGRRSAQALAARLGGRAAPGLISFPRLLRRRAVHNEIPGARCFWVPCSPRADPDGLRVGDGAVLPGGARRRRQPVRRSGVSA